MRKSLLFTLIGVVLGLGAPIGALALLWFFPHPPFDFPISSPPSGVNTFFFLTYMLVGTIVVFATFGFFTGHDEDRILKRNPPPDG